MLEECTAFSLLRVSMVFYIGKEVAQMKLIVTTAAAQYLADQIGLRAGDSVAISGERVAKGQFKIRYQPKEPIQPVATAAQVGISFYVEFAEEWFFSGKQVTIDYRGDDRLAYEIAAEPVPNVDTTKQQPTPAPADASTAASRKYEEYWE